VCRMLMWPPEASIKTNAPGDVWRRRRLACAAGESSQCSIAKWGVQGDPCGRLGRRRPPPWRAEHPLLQLSWGRWRAAPDGVWAAAVMPNGLRNPRSQLPQARALAFHTPSGLRPPSPLTQRRVSVFSPIWLVTNRTGD